MDSALALAKERVEVWSREHNSGTYFNCSPMAYWGDARRAGICTSAEVQRAREWYGALWNYTGD